MAENRCATYARKSTVDQHTTQTQLGLCRKLIDDRGWKERYRLSDDALKGRDPTRPGYQRLLQLADESRIDNIVVWKLDRIFRSLSEASAAHEFLLDRGVSLVSVTEPFDTTTSIGRFLFGNLANFAQFETDLLKERALLGYERRVHEGKWTGAHAPYGYAKAPDGTLRIKHAEAEVIQAMRRAYTKCHGDRGVAALLDKRTMTCRGKPWTADRVRKALTAPILTGKLIQRGCEKRHPHLRIFTPRQQRHITNARTQLRHSGTHQPNTRNEEKLDAIMGAYMEHLEASGDELEVTKPQ